MKKTVIDRNDWIILEGIISGKKTVRDIAEELGVTQTAVHKRIKKLQRAGLVTSPRKEGALIASRLITQKGTTYLRKMRSQYGDSRADNKSSGAV